MHGNTQIKIFQTHTNSAYYISRPHILSDKDIGYTYEH